MKKTYKKIQKKDLGDSGLLEICRRAMHLPTNKLRIICVFDRDNPQISVFYMLSQKAEQKFQIL